ncbi:hypothetical protein [Brevundimonas sp.]|uniref:hypothetical protein n=1 Tax=Brevundimonas sp. TaxID=1871086 RepID=UPI001DCA6A32|nr:hypothetical protein [Brevundimonas sp.]MBL0948736.1 hypothetical protein [Brevundimonas sp.]
MKQLSALEMAAAVALAEQISPDESRALIEQLRTAEVSAREFTGVGFYTEFTVDKSLQPAVVTVSPGGWLRSEVGPDAYPLEFMLYVKDGYAGVIEAYSYFDGYGDIDLLTASFTPPRAIDPPNAGVSSGSRADRGLEVESGHLP